MSKRPNRPWEQELARTQKILQGSGPGVVVDGFKYLSDRFYLNTVAGVASEFMPVNEGRNCSCGAGRPPPLFDRQRLVQSLQLKAAVLGTFTLDIEWLQQAFPHLVGTKATVPTLIVHGHKSFRSQQRHRKEQCEEEDDTSVSELENSQNSVNVSSIPSGGKIECGHPASAQDSTSLYTQDPAQMKFGAGETDSKTQREIPTRVVTITPETSTSNPTGTNFWSEQCHFQYVHSSWEKPADSETTARISTETKSEKVASRESKRGVHHPKFMILFEKSGSVVVVVSTANLTRNETIEGTWIQRFPPNKRPNFPTKNFTTQSGRSPSPTAGTNPHRNDFGPVLQDFLEKLDAATSFSSGSRDTKIGVFFKEQLNIALRDFGTSFLFHLAQVHLIPVVPGDFPIKMSKSILLYGRQRVQAILQRETVVQSETDNLILQPTSLGGNWKQSEMSDVVRSYLSINQSSPQYWDEEGLLERMDIVWPSRKYIQKAVQEYDSRNRNSGDSMAFEADGDSNASSKDDQDEGRNRLFLSSGCFNSCDRSCIARMSRYQLSSPAQGVPGLVPHFKSICRLITKPLVIRDFGFSEDPVDAQAYLSWFLLTSACLSHGAQGKRVKERNPCSASITKEYISYANFELGVLFTSRVEARSRRLYVFSPNNCSCRVMKAPNQHSNMIHLPIPHALHTLPYLDHEEDSIMQETPYFHEIQDETQCVGNMLMTPFGLRKSNRQKIEATGDEEVFE